MVQFLVDLTETKDDDTFKKRIENLEQVIKTIAPDKTILPYFRQKLLPSLERHVIKPVRLEKCPPNWSNNNCESANHILKSATHWKLCDMPKFKEILHGIVKSEQTERNRAIRDMGNFKLHSHFSHHLLNIDMWANISQEQREKREHRFNNDKGRTQQNVVVSSNGLRTVIKTPSAGKKANQVKRKRAERSRTPSAKRRIVN